MIIIAICSAIAILFIVLIISRQCTQPSAPLPNIQPLAHHRSQYLEQLQNSSTTLLKQPTTPRKYTIPLLSATPQPPDPPSPQSHSALSHSTKSSRHTSQIEVVLPAPLALIAGPGASTSTIADNWALAGNGKAISSSRRVCLDHDFSCRSSHIIT